MLLPGLERPAPSDRPTVDHTSCKLPERMKLKIGVAQIFIDFVEGLVNESQVESGRIFIFLKSGHTIGAYSKWNDMIRKSSHFFFEICN